MKYKLIHLISWKEVYPARKLKTKTWTSVLYVCLFSDEFTYVLPSRFIRQQETACSPLWCIYVPHRCSGKVLFGFLWLYLMKSK